MRLSKKIHPSNHTHPLRVLKPVLSLLAALALSLAAMPAALADEADGGADEAVYTVVEFSFTDGVVTFEDEDDFIYDVTEDGYIINGVPVSVDDFASEPSECWVYAYNLYSEIWGEGFSIYIDTEDNLLRGLSADELTLTEEHLREYVSRAIPGAVLRICDWEYLYGGDGWGHSQLIVEIDDEGFTVLEGGLHQSPYKQEHYYTWSEYIETSWLGGNYEYIKYIQWPGAGEAAQS